MGRWAIFFTAVFIICSFFSAQLEYDTVTGYYGRDAVGATKLTVALTDSATPGQTVNVTSTADFSGPTGYFKVNNEVVRYTTKNATHFLGCTRGVADPVVTNMPQATTVVAHSVGAQVYTLAAAAVNAAVGMNVVTAEGTTGEISATAFLWNFFWHFPKYVSWNFPFLDNQAGNLMKLFMLWPLSAGFLVTVGVAMIQLAQGVLSPP
jgi:hypothetical protein